MYALVLYFVCSLDILYWVLDLVLMDDGVIFGGLRWNFQVQYW